MVDCTLHPTPDTRLNTMSGCFSISNSYQIWPTIIPLASSSRLSRLSRLSVLTRFVCKENVTDARISSSVSMVVRWIWRRWCIPWKKCIRVCLACHLVLVIEDQILSHAYFEEGVLLPGGRTDTIHDYWWRFFVLTSRRTCQENYFSRLRRSSLDFRAP